jgi:hypothetical protein
MIALENNTGPSTDATKHKLLENQLSVIEDFCGPQMASESTDECEIRRFEALCDIAGDDCEVLSHVQDFLEILG